RLPGLLPLPRHQQRPYLRLKFRPVLLLALNLSSLTPYLCFQRRLPAIVFLVHVLHFPLLLVPIQQRLLWRRLPSLFPPSPPHRPCRTTTPGPPILFRVPLPEFHESPFQRVFRIAYCFRKRDVFFGRLHPFDPPFAERQPIVSGCLGYSGGLASRCKSVSLPDVCYDSGLNHFDTVATASFQSPLQIPLSPTFEYFHSILTN